MTYETLIHEGLVRERQAHPIFERIYYNICYTETTFMSQACHEIPFFLFYLDHIYWRG